MHEYMYSMPLALLEEEWRAKIHRNTYYGIATTVF